MRKKIQRTACLWCGTGKPAPRHDFCSRECADDWRAAKADLENESLTIAEREQRVRAREAVRQAVASGRLKKLSCEHLGNGCRGVVDAHHDDYSKPLEVRWLCRKHHQSHHRNERRNRLKKPSTL